MSTPELTTPYTTNKETANTRRGNRKGNFRRGNEGEASWSGKKGFKGQTSKLNDFLGLITEIMDQGVTFDRFQDVLKNYVLKNFRKEEDIVEIRTDLNNTVTNFKRKHMPNNLIEKEEESKINMKMWEMRVKRYMD